MSNSTSTTSTPTRIAIVCSEDGTIDVVGEVNEHGGWEADFVFYQANSLSGAMRWCRDNLNVDETTGWTRYAPAGYLKTSVAR